MADGRIEIDTRVNQDGINKGVKEVKDKLSKVGDGLKDVGENMNKYVTLPLMAMAGGAIKVASDFNTSQAQIQNSLGLTADEASTLNDTVKSVWKDGFGESLGDVTNSLLEVKQNMSNLDDGELEVATKNAMTLAKTFDSDVNEVTRAGNNLMKNFGLESGTAFDLMAFGAQNGLNFSKEMFDNLAEYSPLFADMGYSAEEMFGILMRGADAGVYNFDYLNDVMKEFGIRISDNSKGTSDAMEGMSKSTQNLFKEFQNGKATSADMATAIANDLAKMDSDVKRNELGVQLFGTKWEDLGGDVVLSMLASEQAISGFEGSMAGMVETQEQTFGQRFQSTLRNLLAALEPLGTVLLDMAEQWLPKIASAAEKVSNWFANLSPALQTAMVIFGAIAAVLGPVITVLGIVVGAISSLIGPVTAVVGWFAKLSALGPVLSGALSALAGPVGIVIAVIGALIAVGIALYKNWDEVSAYASKVWEAIKNTISKAWESIKTTTSSVWNSIKSFLSGVWEGIKSVVSNVASAIVDFVKQRWENIKTNTSSIFNSVKSTITTIWNNIKSSISNVVSNILTAVKDKFDSMKEAVGEKMANVKSTIEEMWNKAQAFFEGIDLISIGKNIIGGLIKGIGDKASELWDKAKEIANGVKDRIAGAFEINSPSRWMRDFVAGNLYKGFEVGVDKQASNFKGTTETMTNLMMPKPEQLVRLSPNGISNMMTNLQQMLSLKIMLDSETIGYAVTPVVAREIAFEARG